MSSYLIKNAKVVDPNSPHKNKTVDILIENGNITQIGKDLKADKSAKVIEHENMHVSPGWFDMQANFCDPGYEFREDLQSGMRAAAQGGFTGVCVMPATNPPLQTKSQIEYVVNTCKNNAVDVYPAGCLTQNSEGKEMTEMYDMKKAGAIAFTDFKHSIEDSGLLVRLLQYAQNTNTLIITHCEEESLTAGGQMNEGETSTHLGLKGMPALAEELVVQRNINLLSYAGGKMHIPTVSSKYSLDCIKQAKNKNIQVSAGVAAHQLLLNDEQLEEFDTNLKVTPPLRDKSETEALKRAIANDVIDVIVSDHCPQDIENKDVEFDHAGFGIIALETAYASANTALHEKIENEKLIEKLSINPRKILGLHIASVKVGEKANLTFFNPALKWEFTEKHISSKSKNTPFVGYHFTGKALGVINNGKMVICK
jgi:dihydroorotase